MKQIAVLLTCFNRKDKTISALNHLQSALYKCPQLSISIYLTDDGSTDGTGEAVKEKFPEVKVLQGTGDLFWAGGMLNSWEEALKKPYDAFLLLNDDTNVKEDLFNHILQTHQYSLKDLGAPGIYIGSTKDEKSGSLTYGGAVFTNRFMFKFHFLPPNGQIQSCELGNANIMLVTSEVVSKIGILANGYRHGVADYDYTLRALKEKIPLLVLPEYAGTCAHDHDNIYDTFPDRSFKERFKLLNSPLGLDFSSNFLLMRKHFPIRVPFVLFAAILKVIYPKLYIKSRVKN